MKSSEDTSSQSKNDSLAPPRSSQQAQLDEELNELKRTLVDLETERAVLVNLVFDHDARAASPTTNGQGKLETALDIAQQTKRNHIKLLSTFNEIKDIGQGLVGLVADQRGQRIVDVMHSLGFDADD